MIFNFSHTTRKERKGTTARGFSLVELIIAVGIFMIISTALLFNYSSFNSRIQLDTLAQQIGQWVRDAQVTAMSVRQAVGSTTQFPGYGLHFDMANTGQFIYFADLNGNRIYDAGGTCGTAGVECEKVIKLLKGSRIVSLCGLTNGQASTAACPNPLGASSQFDIVFKRPNPDALITGDKNGSNFPTTYSQAIIKIASVKNYQRTIEVWLTGQISVR